MSFSFGVLVRNLCVSVSSAPFRKFSMIIYLYNEDEGCADRFRSSNIVPKTVVFCFGSDMT